MRARRTLWSFAVAQRVRIGLPLAVAYLWIAQPTPWSIALGLGVATIGIALRTVAAGHLRKNEALTTVGPYAFTRHPLYLGSLLIECGLLLAGRSWTAGLVGVTYFLCFYPEAMAREEEKLRRRYGSAYDEYAAHVPAFWPRPAAWDIAQWRFSWALYRRNREFQSAIGVLLAGGALWLKAHGHT